MTTSNPLLSLFKEQLECECKEIGQRFDLTERGRVLIFWYFTRLHDFTESEVDSVVCDGGGDLGIDVIWIDEEELVHFYQFKNPVDAAKSVPTGEIDRVMSGLRLILHRQHQTVANPELKARIEEVYQQVPKGYRLHVVSTGDGIYQDAVLKLEGLAKEINGSTSSSIFQWEVEKLCDLQEKFYQQTLPAVREPIKFSVAAAPYAVRSGFADCYLFHLPGGDLANLYAKHGEGLLQRNIRVDQRATATNRSIEASCSGSDSSNFLHFNNGITFLTDSATYDTFQRTMTLERAQVVNGGQTIRALHRAKQKGLLKDDVLVPARVITSRGDKDFGNNVAVNQNNQNQVGTGFLRSNDQRVVQLDHALAARGWYLERREGELKSATPEEKAAIERRIQRDLEGRVIKLKDAAQAYTATFYGQPEIAKKHVKKIFLSVEDGGYYEKIFSPEMTAERIQIAHEIKQYIEAFVQRFVAINRRISKEGDRASAYRPLFGSDLADTHADVLHQVMPQCSLFLCGTTFRDLKDNGDVPPSDIPKVFLERGDALICTHLKYIIEFAKKNKDKATQSWPLLLKSNVFFGHVCAYIAGVRHSEAARMA